MTKRIRKGAEEARSQLPELLTAAQQGRQTIITRHGRPVAILAPVSSGEAHPQRSLLPLAGTGRGLYGRDSQATLRRLRDEWSR
jgi:prevent-host-death family protein